MGQEQTPAALLKLLCVTQQQCWQRGERPSAESYLEQHPTLASDPTCAVELIFQEFLLREQLGEAPQPEEFIARFPQFAEPLKLVFQVDRQIGERWPKGEVTFPPGSNAEAGMDRPPNGDYEIVRELGRGGMSVVYQARHVSLNRMEALKLIRDVALAGPDQRRRFHTEAEAIACLQHPNIVQIFDVGEQNGQPYLALEFMEGGSLEEQLGGMPQPARAAAQLVETLARAVHIAHQHGIIHRDLKPANVLLTAEGLPKIADFGLAKFTTGHPGQTESGAILGTLGYMAPEQAGGQTKDPGSAVDVYSLGAILYETLTGRPPFRAETPLETMRQVQVEEPVSVERLQPKVPRDLNTICLKCLQKEPRKRYTSAEALAEDLRRFLAGEPIQARPIQMGERAVKWVKRRPALAALLGVSGLAALALVGVGVGLWYNGQLVTAIDEANKQRAAAERLRAEAVTFQLRVSYARDMNLAFQAFEGEFDGQVLDLLNGLRPQPGQEDIRGFEWSYLWRRLHSERFTWREQKNVWWSVFSPDGKTLATRCGEETARLWNVATGKLQGTLSDVPRQALAFSPDSKTMAAGKTDGTVRLWEVATGIVRTTLPGHQGAVQSLAYSPDGTLLVTGSTDGTTKLWNLAAHQERAILPGHRGAVQDVALSPNGQTVATACADGTVRLWDMAKGAERDPQARAHEGVEALAFAPDNKTLLTRDERSVVLWDVATGQRRVTLSTRSGYVITGIAFAPDGKTLVTTEAHPFLSASPGYVKLRDAATGKELATWTVPLQAWGAAFAPDGRTLAAGNGFGVVRLLDIATKEVRATFRGHTTRVSTVAFSPDGTMLASSATWDQTIKLWDVTADPEPGILRLDHAGWAAAIAPDGKTLAQVHGQSGTLWDVKTGQAQATLVGHGQEVNCVAFAPDGMTLATGSNDKTVRLWDRALGEQLAVLPGHTDRVTDVAFAPDGKTLASCSWDHTVRLWDVATRQERMPLKGHTSQVWRVAFTPDGQMLASGSEDKTIKLWDLATGLSRFTLEGHGNGVMSVAIAPDGKTLASGGWDGTVRLWDPTTGKEHATLRGHMSHVKVVAFAPDGKTLASGSYDHTVKLWDVVTGLERLTLKGHTGLVHSVAFAPDGKLLVTASMDKTVRLWHAADEKEQQQPRLTNVPSPEHLFAWHLREAEASEREGQWFAVVFHLSRLIDAQPADLGLYGRRGVAHAMLGQYDRARQDLTKAFWSRRAE